MKYLYIKLIYEKFNKLMGALKQNNLMHVILF